VNSTILPYVLKSRNVAVSELGPKYAQAHKPIKDKQPRPNREPYKGVFQEENVPSGCLIEVRARSTHNN